jgi:MFS family permease
MFEKLAARARNSDVDVRLLVPLLLNTALVQIVTAIIRITTSYRAFELGLSTVWLGVIAAAFALFPIMIAVGVGRYIDRGHDARIAWIGSSLFLAGCAGFTVWPTAGGLLVSSLVMGAGHLMLMATQQMLCVRAAGTKNMESVFGNYMVAGAIGQGIGPYVVGWAGGGATVPPTQPLFLIGLAVAVASLAVALTIRPAPKRSRSEAVGEVVTVGALLRVPGLLTVVIAGVILVASSDIIIIYVPLLGAERHIDVSDIGLLLTMRAAASMVGRLFYARIVAHTGRWPLMVASTMVYAAAFAMLAAPLSLLPMYAFMAIMGFAFGLATTLSITIVVDMTAAGARGTANSLRIMGNRLGQFVLPFGAGLIAAASGLSALLLVSAVAVAVSAAAMHLKRPSS